MTTKTALINTPATLEVARHLCVIAKKQIVCCLQPGDAASPVYLIAGPFVRQIGQSADWKHAPETVCPAHNALYVSGLWDNDRNRWLVIVPSEFAPQLATDLRCRTLAQEEAAEARRLASMTAEIERLEADRPRREAYRIKWAADVDARKAELLPLFTAAMSKCRTKANGRLHRGDQQEVRRAYQAATGEGVDGAYPEDLARWRAVLAHLAEHGPAMEPAL